MTASPGVNANPYGVNLYTVVTPAGSELHLQTQEEADWYESRRDRYQADNMFPNISDLQDLDRLLMLEVLSYRWGLWMGQGFDYLMTRVDEGALKNNIKEYCLSQDTEILTRRGWMTVVGLLPGEDVLTLNPDTGLSEWQPLQMINAFPPSGALYSMETREISALATADHRWWVQRDTNARSGLTPFQWRPTTELDQYCWIPTAAPHDSFPVEPKHSDPLVELVAWWWTEGYCDSAYHQGEVAQSQARNPEKTARIRRALRRQCGEPGDLKRGKLWNETARNGMAYFNLSTALVRTLEQHAPGRAPSAWFLQELTQGQLTLFIQCSLDGDGSINSGGGWSIAQADETKLRGFQVAAILAGYQANIAFSPASGKAGMWTMNRSRRTRARPALREPEIVTGHPGLVWCPTVANGIWLARCNGRAFYTGNSVEIRLLKASLGIDKSTRDKDKGESLSDYTDKLLERAKVFGYHRNDQYALAVTKFYELRSMVNTYDRCDADERTILDLSMESIFDWIRESLIKEWDEMSLAFRKTQSVWIREM